jgi:DeoR/GlpR family transcriptional regulator of sugar metabolism
MMEPKERREAILTSLAEGGYVPVDALARQLDVSQMTIRRDLDRLEEERVVLRVHGGATLNDGRGSRERAVDERVTDSQMEKRAIGREAATLIRDGDTVMIDAGTTTVEIARHLIGRTGITVVTNSLAVLETLAQSPGTRVIGTGGEIKHRERAFVGPVAETMLSQRRATIAFISAAGCSLSDGPTDYEDSEVAIKRTMLACSYRPYLIFDASKFGRVAPLVIAPLNEFDGIVTDTRLADEVAVELRQRELHVLCARPMHPNRNEL